MLESLKQSLEAHPDNPFLQGHVEALTAAEEKRDARRSAPPLSASEFAVQYWLDGKGWCESNIYESSNAAYHAYIRLNAAMPQRPHRVIERITTERVLFESNAPAMARPEQP